MVGWSHDGRDHRATTMRVCDLLQALQRIFLQCVQYLCVRKTVCMSTKTV